MSEKYSFVFCMACGGMISLKKNFKFKNFFFHFILLHLNFLCYCCSINLKSQSEHSGLCPDTSSLVVFSNWSAYFVFLLARESELN